MPLSLPVLQRPHPKIVSQRTRTHTPSPDALLHSTSPGIRKRNETALCAELSSFSAWLRLHPSSLARGSPGPPDRSSPHIRARRFRCLRISPLAERLEGWLIPF
jgi:hypothetical protein